MYFVNGVLILILCFCFIQEGNLQLNKVKLGDIKELVFRKGVNTTGRVPKEQIKCVEGVGLRDQPNTIKCFKSKEKQSVKWECENHFGDNFTFHYVVSCEGYDRKGDPYVVEGSCYIRYKINEKYVNKNQYEKIKVEDIKILTFASDVNTTVRRLAPQPQLQCIGGSAGCNSSVPNFVICYYDNSTSEFECEFTIDPTVRLGHRKIVCESYYDNDNTFMLVDSCALIYKLESNKEKDTKTNNVNKTSLIISCVIGFTVGIILFVILSYICYTARTESKYEEMFPENPTARRVSTVERSLSLPAYYYSYNSEQKDSATCSFTQTRYQKPKEQLDGIKEESIEFVAYPTL